MHVGDRFRVGGKVVHVGNMCARPKVWKRFNLI